MNQSIGEEMQMLVCEDGNDKSEGSPADRSYVKEVVWWTISRFTWELWVW
jgi:hypothetical protein